MPEGAQSGPQRIIGRYALYGEIAAGGMATVHAGRLLGPVGFSRTVAIKRLHPQYAKDPEFVSMFLDEARVAARIQHPNVVPTLDVVAMEGELFLVMEYVEGESLARILRTLRMQGRKMPPKIAASIVCNALYGLHAAHEARSERGEPLGIVHRDVSPQNLLVGTDGSTRVLDFGVAKAAGRIQTTREGQVKGKLAYMPPEQLAGDKVDRRLDVYAAAVVLWETLTAQRLFDGDNEGAVLQKVLHGVITPPSTLVEGLSPEVDAVILKGLARNPNERYATAREMAVALEDVLGVEPPRRVAEFVDGCAGESIAVRAARIKEIESSSTDPGQPNLAEISGVSGAVAPVAGFGAGVVPSRSGSMTSLEAVTPPPTQRSRGVFVVLGIVGAIGLVVLLAVVFTSRSTTTASSGTAPPSSAPVASAPPTGAPAEVARAATATSTAPSPATSSGSSPGSSGSAPASSSATAAAGSAKAAGGSPGKPGGGHVASPSKPPTNCNPPYVIVDGIRKIKPECL
jgi:serine/threonine-protein kinase